MYSKDIAFKQFYAINPIRCISIYSEAFAVCTIGKICVCV